MDFKYYLPTKVLFGCDKLEQLHQQKLPGRKALIVTTIGNSMVKYGQLNKVQHQLDLSGTEYVVFKGIGGNPEREQIMKAVNLFHEGGCDFIIGLGGGSCIDASKAIAISASNGGDIWDYIYGDSDMRKPVKNKMVPLVAIPTTAGTGSEVDQWMVISDRLTKEKVGFGYSKSFPMMAVVDPTLTESIPPHLTAYQGMDAFFHSTEGYISAEANPLTDILALKVIQLISDNLPKCVKNGKDRKARMKVSLASTLSGIVLANTSMTAEHGIEDGLSGFFPDVPHGAGLIAISEAYYTKIAAKGHSEERLIEMAKAMGVENAESGYDFITSLKKLLSDCNVDDIKLSDYGVEPWAFPQIISNAKKNAASEFLAEKQLLTDEECISILQTSFK